MGIEFKKRYLRLVRRAYRFLRSPKLHRFPWVKKILRPIFDRELWHPCRDTVSTGLAIGLFVSMLPIIGQMFLAAIGAVRFRANVPIAIAACWVSNPATQLFIFALQENLGDFLKERLGIPVPAFLEIHIPKIMGFEIPDFNVFYRYYANYPFYSDAIWYLTQMRRWGQIGETKPDSWYMDVAKKVYKPEIYKQAAEMLLKEGKIAKGDVPWDTDGFKAPQSEFIDGITFNGKEPNAYLANFPIGLKTGEIVKSNKVVKAK